MGKQSQNVPNDLMSDLVRLHASRPEFKDAYLRRMIITNFGAGHETTCSALTSAIALIGCRPGVQEEVWREIEDWNRDLEDENSLKYTMACIKEAQRLHPVIGMSLSRKVPASGMAAHGHYFPPGTVVGCNPVALHRNPEIYGRHAKEFDPERWMTGDIERRRAMARYNLTYGGGRRSCPGQHLAELIVHRVVPVLFKEFEIQVTMPHEEEIQYYFMAMLTGVKVRFLQRKR